MAKPSIYIDRVGDLLSEANSSDVILGRGKTSLDHVGNKRFKIIVNLHAADYERAGGKTAKTLISIKIVDIIYNSSPPGRFLQVCPETRKFYEVSRERARERVSQYLREAVNPPKPRPRGKTPRKEKKEKPVKKKERKMPEKEVVKKLIDLQEQYYHEMIEELRERIGVADGSIEDDSSEC